jgi:hypothetical protein
MPRFRTALWAALLCSITFSIEVRGEASGLNIRIPNATTWTGRPDTQVPYTIGGIGPRAEFTLNVNLAGFTANGEFADPTNTRQTFNLLPNAFVTKVEWVDLVFHTLGASFQDEFVLSANNSNETEFFDHGPSTLAGPGTYGPASGTFGIPPERAAGGPFQLRADGQLLVFVYELFNDAGADAVVDSGTLRVTYSDDPPPPPPPPATIGTLVASDTSPNYPTPDVTANKTGGNVQWYKIVVPNDVTGTNGLFLDIDTEGASDAAASFDTQLALFSSTGVLLAEDDDSGSGPTSQLTFGDAGPRGPLTTFPAVDPGLPGDGFNGDLLAGEYYLAVAGFETVFANGFSALSDSTSTTALIPVNLRTNVPEPACATLLAVGMACCLRRRSARGR